MVPDSEFQCPNTKRSEDDLPESLKAIARELPPVVFRNWRRWRDVLPMAPGSVANDDCLGIGPKERIFVGRVCGYPKRSLLEYMAEKTKVLKR